MLMPVFDIMMRTRDTSFKFHLQRSNDDKPISCKSLVALGVYKPSSPCFRFLQAGTHNSHTPQLHNFCVDRQTYSHIFL